jgi:hypothetical protein
MKRLKELWRRPAVRYPAGILVGAAAGFAYYWTIGCPTGGCPISSNPYLMLALGGFMGYTLVAEGASGPQGGA